jgi:hypothetical protein
MVLAARSSSAAAAEAMVILVQAALVAAHPVTDPANQKSLDLPVHLELEVKPTAY